MKAEIPNRDDVVHRIDHRHWHATFGRGGRAWSCAAVGKTRQRDRTAADGAEQQRESLPCGCHGHLTTTTAFMNGCGVQWNAYSPGCVKVWLQRFSGAIEPGKRWSHTFTQPGEYA